ncbi:inversin-A-like [Ptychodera flava]|uniref:inversin-A-like n=1 Tax=Ptychodera flava TaxID=63121 RepID=UPI00396A6B08
MNLEDELLFTAHSGKKKALDKFLKKNGTKVDINCTSNDGATPLIQCVQGSRMAKDATKNEYILCCRRLIAAGAALNHRDQLGRTALHWAVFYNKSDLVAELLNESADPKIEDDGGQNVFHFAVRIHAVDSLVVLCDLGDTEVLEEPNSKGIPLIIYAIQQGHLDSCEVLVTAGVDVNKKEECDVNKTASHCAIETKRLDLLEFLLSNEARPDVVDANDITAVDLACMSSDCRYLETIIKYLKEKKMSTLSSANEKGITPLMIACQRENHQQIKLLIIEGVPLDTKCNKGKTALHYTVENKEAECAEALLEANSSIADVKDKDGHTALHLATIGANKVLVSVLIKYADINGTDLEKHTPVHWATVCGHGDLIEYLIQNGAEPSLPDIHDAYPMHYAAQMCGDTQVQHLGLRCLKALLKNKAAYDCKDNNGRQPLLWAASAGSSAACQMLVQEGADVMATDKDMLTALHCAGSRGHPECVKTLVVDCKSEVDPKDKNGCTPLFYALTLGHLKCVSLLLEYNASTTTQDIKGRSPAHCAAVKGNLGCLKLLANAKAPLNMANKAGNHPLHDAIHKGHRDVVQYLLEFGCDPNSANDAGMTALHQAAAANNEVICKMLVDAGARVNEIMKTDEFKYSTPLDSAMEKGGNRYTVEYLKSVGGKRASSIINDASIIIGRTYRNHQRRRELEAKEKEEGGNTPGSNNGESGEQAIANGDIQKQNSETNTASVADSSGQQRNEQQKNGETTVTVLENGEVKEEEDTENKKDTEKTSKKMKSPYLAPQPWLADKKKKGTKKVQTQKAIVETSYDKEASQGFVKPVSLWNGEKTPPPVISRSPPRNSPTGRPRATRSAGTRRAGASTPTSVHSEGDAQKNALSAELREERQNELIQTHHQQNPRNISPITRAEMPIDSDLIAFEVQQKMLNWDKYLEEELSFLDEIIKCNHPAFDEIHEEAELYKAELARHLNELKRRVDHNSRQLDISLRHEAEKDKENNDKMEQELQEGLEEADNTFTRVSMGARESRLKTQQQNDLREEQLNRLTPGRRPTLEQWLRMKTMDYYNPPLPIDDDSEEDEIEEIDIEQLRKNKHTEWVKKKNMEYAKKKQSVRPQNVRFYKVKPVKVTRPGTGSKKESMNPDWRPSSVQPQRSTAAPTPMTLPHYVKSPFSHRTTKECPQYKKAQPQRNQMFPGKYSSAQMRLMRGNSPNSLDGKLSYSSATQEETYDLRASLDNSDSGGANRKAMKNLVSTRRQDQLIKDRKQKPQSILPQGNPSAKQTSSFEGMNGVAPHSMEVS